MPILNDTGMKIGWLVGTLPPKRLSAVLLVKGTFELVRQKPAVLVEEQAGLDGDERDPLGKEAIRRPTDFAFPKPHCDLLLTGSAYAPAGTRAETLRVLFSVGEWQKSLRVVGDRVVKESLLDSVPAKPVPFQSMPLSYARSYGGEGYKLNPDGRGHSRTALPGGGVGRVLPNIVHEDELTSTSAGRLGPVGFGPLPEVWPQRMDKARKATYDATWMKTLWPGFPRDFDFTYFNAAPEDQQLRRALRGDETYRVDGCLPDYPRFVGSLPGLRVRWFVNQQVEARTKFFEVPLRLDTLWIDMEARRLQLTWRGAVPVRSKGMQDLLDHLVVSEPSSEQPLPAEHYAAVLEKKRAVAVVPEGAESVEAVPPGQVDSPDISWIEEIEKEAAALQEEAAEAAREQTARWDSLAKELAEQGFNVSRTNVSANSTPSTPPLPTESPAVIQAIEAAAPGASRGLVGEAPAALQWTMPPEVPVIEGEADEEMAEEKTWTRESVVIHAASHGSFASQDLEGLDLSGLDLSGLDFTGAVLAAANLQAANLERAGLAEAVLAGADLRATRMRGAILDGADLAGGRLSGADLSNASLRAADLSGADLSEALLVSASLPEAILIEANLAGADLRGASLPQADLDGARLDGAILEKAVLRAASLEGASGKGVRASHADLTEVRASDTMLAESLFVGVKAAGSVWENAGLKAADFRHSHLSGSNFEGADLTRANFERCDLRQGRFPGANLESAVLAEANLFRGTLEGADLTRANFILSNLYEVEFLDAVIKDTRFEGANLKGSKLA
jgi:uncharacterized protein YjbI with pentapeptide repeats